MGADGGRWEDFRLKQPPAKPGESIDKVRFNIRTTGRPQPCTPVCLQDSSIGINATLQTAASRANATGPRDPTNPTNALREPYSVGKSTSLVLRCNTCRGLPPKVRRTCSMQGPDKPDKCPPRALFCWQKHVAGSQMQHLPGPAAQGPAHL